MAARGQPAVEDARTAPIPDPTSPAQLPPIRLSLPPPEELGLVAATTWPEIRARLDQWGAIYYRLERVPAGYRMICALPYRGQSGVVREFEVQAQSEQAAGEALLQAIVEWLEQNRQVRPVPGP
ncbi:MAG: hypothetical protein C4297_07245 [Gemmataceae bacterium]